MKQPLMLNEWLQVNLVNESQNSYQKFTDLFTLSIEKALFLCIYLCFLCIKNYVLLSVSKLNLYICSKMYLFGSQLMTLQSWALSLSDVYAGFGTCKRQ